MESTINVFRFLILFRYLMISVVAEAAPTREQYLGQVFTMENTVVYTLYTPTHLKFMVVIKWQGAPPTDSVVKSVR